MISLGMMRSALVQRVAELTVAQATLPEALAANLQREIDRHNEEIAAIDETTTK